ncbi:MAG: hypothetical protein M0Z85_06695 [Gammaproteobacteria bacterium]|nr:hypothetical protein [Gammaproteobacteria bacterium]
MSYVREELEVSPQYAAERLNAGAVLLDVRMAQERELFGVPPGAVHWPLAVVQRFRGETPNPECETFSARDRPCGLQCLTPEERALFTRWLIGHAARQSELLRLYARGNRSLMAAHILRDPGYPRAPIR